MDYHGRIMNIGINPSSAGQCSQCQPMAAYTFGHRDARHAAAEIALEAQAEIARLREALEKIAKGRTGLDPEESDAEWRAYWASLCIDYRGTARAALATVEGVGK